MSRTGSRDWARKLWSIVFIIFCVEIGLFLLVYPWTEFWGDNFFFSLDPRLTALLLSGYARGLLSGLGVLNLYIAVSEIVRLRRFAVRTPAPSHTT